ncbi:MAG TPA: prephenate dehydratase domain-containing protein [Pyrinomonadaceae bacterium]|jgi:prephenate dehydratase|nr:prephenate dehydratase domain-containing protein [Pyrinomonadaceae bacterium]
MAESNMAYVANSKTRVAFQGERGAFSEDAAVKLLGEDIELVPRQTFAALYASLNDRVADYLLAPIENSIAGPVKASVDLLNESRLLIINEITIPVLQQLIACPGASFGEVNEVQSHPMALAQCGRFFAEHPDLRQIESDDTAGSVVEILRRGDLHRAAIAGKRAASIYGGVIICENIQDDRDNFTRFVLLANSTKKE